MDFGVYIFTSRYAQIHGDHKSPYQCFCPTFHFSGLHVRNVKYYGTLETTVFYILKVLFCFLLFASSMPTFKESDNVTTDLIY